MTTTDTALRAAQRTDDTKAMAAALRRSGVEFSAYVTGLVQAIDSAEDAVRRLRVKRDRWTDARRVAAGECVTCRDLGYVSVHVPSDRAMIDSGRRPCRACASVPRPPRAPYSAETIALADAKIASERTRNDWRSLGWFRAEIEAEGIFGNLQRAAREKLQAERKALAPFYEAARITKGALVAMENTRARGKFKDGSRVPVGTEGFVFWISDDQARIGVKVADGRSFFTASTNLSRVALNGWDRVMGIDAESEAKAAREVAYQTTATLKRGDQIEVNGVRLKVFWTGACKRTGRQRWGAKATSKGEATWGYSDEIN